MIRAVGRALSIFDAFDSQHRSLTLQEIGERIGMPKATTFRLVNTLQESGFLVRRSDQRYCLSFKITRLAGLVESTLGIRDIARPVMQAVSRRTGETITLNTRSGLERICIDVVETPSQLMTIVRAGEHVPLMRGATARLLLAYVGDADIDAAIAAHGADVDVQKLKSELARFREQGYAVTSGERIPGVTAIAVPVFDLNNVAQYALALTGPSFRVDARLQECVTIMCDAGRELSAAMGSMLPDPAGAEAPRARTKAPASA